MGYSLRNSTTSKVAGDDTTPTFTLPSYQENDLLVAVVAVRSQNGGYGITGVPAGWTDLYSPDFSGYDYIGIYGKIAGASETNPTFNIGSANVISACISSWTGGPSSLTGIVHKSNSGAYFGSHPYATPALTSGNAPTENGCLVIYATTANDDLWQFSGSTLPSGTTGLCVSDADAKNDGTYSDLSLLVAYQIQTTAASIDASSFSSGNSQTLTVNSIIAALIPGASTIKYLKALIASSAAGASSVAGTVFDAPSGGDITGNKIGEFTGQAFLGANSLDGGKAKMLVNVASFGGSALTTANTPHVYLRTSSFDTGIFPATVIEV